MKHCNRRSRPVSLKRVKEIARIDEMLLSMHKKLAFYGLENRDLLSIQTRLSFGEADEHFCRVAKLRSRAMFNNLIDLMDREQRERVLLYISGFHHMVFEELAKANAIRYEYEFVHKLPRYERSAQRHG